MKERSKRTRIFDANHAWLRVLHVFVFFPLFSCFSSLSSSRSLASIFLPLFLALSLSLPSTTTATAAATTCTTHHVHDVCSSPHCAFARSLPLIDLLRDSKRKGRWCERAKAAERILLLALSGDQDRMAGRSSENRKA